MLSGQNSLPCGRGSERVLISLGTMSGTLPILVLLMFASNGLSSSTTYVSLDTTTQGAWSGVYGADGFIIANGVSNAPSYATVSLTGQSAWTWNPSTSDPRALQTSSGSSTGIASTYYAASSFSIGVNLTDGNTHKIALYLLDWDSGSRAETISILDANTHAVLSTQSFSSFQNGQFASWDVKGNVTIQVNLTGGENAVVSGIFFGGSLTTPAPAISAVTATGITSTSATITWTTDQASSSLVEFGPPPGYGLSSGIFPALVTSHSVRLLGLTPGTSYDCVVVSAKAASTSSTSSNCTFNTVSSGGLSSSATYIGFDTATQGTWTPTYGGEGYIIGNDVTHAPAYAAVSLTGASVWTWAASTSDPRALQTARGSSTRIASTYYASNSFTINVNLRDGNTHRIAVYLLDWDAGSRAETISILDAGTQAVLNSQTFSGFQNGVYASWDVKGNVIIQARLTGGENAVLAGIFFASSAASGPVISAVTASNITSTSATIAWTTDQASSSLVNYGTSIAYGSASKLSSTFVTGHSAALSGLTADTTYNYDVVSANVRGTSSTSANFTFSTPAARSARYIGLDTTTQGTWTGHYGASGYLIANEANTLPGYAAVSLTNESTWTFTSSTADTRALQVSGSSASRIASAYYSKSGSFVINLNLTDGTAHRIALYLLDWDTTKRAETITIVDATSHAVFDSRSFSGFQNGQYAAWNITGNVIIQVNGTAGINAVVSGIFVD